jgi:uncharacterized membrane protein
VGVAHPPDRKGFPTGPPALWLDPSTLLPIQVRSQSGGVTVKTTIQWLAPTAANRALLVAPTPAGFKKVNGPAVRQFTAAMHPSWTGGGARGARSFPAPLTKGATSSTAKG